MSIIRSMIESLKVAREKHQNTVYPSSYLNRLIYKEAGQFLVQLENAIYELGNNETEGYNKAQALLMDHWRLIASTPFSYLCQNQHYITELCHRLATELHRMNPEVPVYKFLMPSLEHLEDSILYIYDELDQCPLDAAILADDEKSLIPVALLTYLNYHGYVDPQLLINPYSGKNLSANELQRLKNHNSQTLDLVDTFELIQTMKAGNNSAGGHVHRLIIALRQGGEHGGFGGKEFEASPIALNGIIKFMEYWEHVPSQRKNELAALKSSGDKLNFGQLLAILDKSDQVSFDCVESLAGLLEKTLEENTQIFYNEEPADLLYLTSLFQRFNILKKEISQKVSGQDVQERINIPLLLSLDAVENVNSVQDLIELIKLFSENDLIAFKEQLMRLIHHYVQKSEDLESLFVATTAAFYPFILDNLNEAQEEELSNFDFIVNTLAQLNNEQRDAFFSNYKQRISVNLEQQKQLVFLISYLPENHRQSFLNILGANAIDLFIQDSLSLRIGLRYLSLEHCDQICKKIGKNFPGILENGAVLGELMGCIDNNKRTTLFNHCLEHLTTIIKSGQQFADVLIHIDDEQSKSLCKLLLTSKVNPLKNSYQLCQALFPLSMDKRHLVFNAIRSFLPSIMCRLTDFHMTMKHMNKEDQETFRQDLKNILQLATDWEGSDEVLFKNFLAKRRELKARDAFFKNQETTEYHESRNSGTNHTINTELSI